MKLLTLHTDKKGIKSLKKIITYNTGAKDFILCTPVLRLKRIHEKKPKKKKRLPIRQAIMKIKIQ